MIGEDEGGTGQPRWARTRARAWALQVLYRWESEGDGSPGASLADTLRARRVAPERREHLKRIVEGLDKHRREVDEALRAVLENWRLERLSVIDRSVLRIGAVEMLYLEDVPPRVAIQEAVRLAQRYGGRESAAFVNGVLDALLRERVAGSS